MCSDVQVANGTSGLRHAYLMEGTRWDWDLAGFRFSGAAPERTGMECREEVSTVEIAGPCDPHVKEVVRAAQTELKDLIRQRTEIMKRIGTVRQTLLGLANLFGDEVLGGELIGMGDRKGGGRQPGFTRACRRVLMTAETPLSAREICERLRAQIPLVLDRHKDPIASVTTVLNRLVEYGEAHALFRDDGRRTWQWVADQRMADQRVADPRAQDMRLVPRVANAGA